MLTALTNNLIPLLLLGVACGTVATTITKSSIFRPLREKLGRLTSAGQPTTWLGKLFSCPYCLAHWICCPVILYFLHPVVWEDAAVGWAVLIFLSAMTSGLIQRATPFAGDGPQEELYTLEEAVELLQAVANDRKE